MCKRLGSLINTCTQTAFGVLIRDIIPKIDYKREIHKLFDGGEVALDWIAASDSEIAEDTPIVLFLPGLSGDSQCGYMKSFINAARWRLKARCVVFNYRGCGGHDPKTSRTYCAANSEDLASVISHIKTTYPNAMLLALGVSLGGIILGNYLAEHGEKAAGVLSGAMMVSASFDPFKCTVSMERKGLNLMVNRYLTKCLIDSVKRIQHYFVNSKLCNLDYVYKSSTLKEFDERFTCHQFGYKDCNDYYNDTKISGKLNRIKIPVLALNAEDDPFSPGETLPKDEAKLTDHFVLLSTSYGGHCGFLEGYWSTNYHFSERVFEQFFKTITKYSSGPAEFEGSEKRTRREKNKLLLSAPLYSRSQRSL